MLLNFKVIKTENLTNNILELVLRPERPFAYEAGDYIKMGTEAEDLKPFSIGNAPRDDGLIEIHVKNYDDSDFMQALFNLQSGDTVIVDGPHKQFQLDEGLSESEKTIILIAGGTGFSPMKALLDELIATNCANPIQFYWGARKQEELYHRKSLLALADHHENLSYIEVLSEDNGKGSQKQGQVHQVCLEAQNDLLNSRVYLCGPWPMIQAAKEDFVKAGLPDNQFN